MVKNITKNFVEYFDKYPGFYAEFFIKAIEQFREKGSQKNKTLYLKLEKKGEYIWIEYEIKTQQISPKLGIIKQIENAFSVNILLCYVSDSPMPDEFLDRYSLLKDKNEIHGI